MTPDRSGTASLLADLSPAQRRAVETDASPLCILAGAGSGKTRVLTRRIAYRLITGSADPGHVLALTFTRRAAGELGQRLRSLGIRDRLTAGTFHGVAYAQLRQYWADRGEPEPTLLDRKTALLARLVGGRPDMAGAALGELAAEIEWASARLVTPAEYPARAEAARRRLPVTAEAMAALYARYQSEKVRRRLLDFDDLLARCADAVERDPAFAAVQRWRWRHLFVDEFQDLNPLQYRLLTAWLGDQHDVCVVGDPHQAVYGWNGADPTLLTRLPERWPTTEIIHLDDNHRSTPQVVATAAAVLGEAGGSLRSSRSDGAATAVRSYPDDAGEAHGVAAELRQRHGSGLPWSAMAVLVRTNAQVRAFEVACRSAQIPYRLAGARPLMDDPDVRSLLAEVRRRSAEPFAAIAADLADLASPAPAPAPDPDSCSHSGYGSDSGSRGRDTDMASRSSDRSADRSLDRSDDRRGAARALADLAADYQGMESRPTVAGYVTWLGPATSRDRLDDGPPGVTLSTFHRAKGLEWQAVWVAGLEEGLVPIAHAQTDEAEDEERRILYVALTRAGNELHCSWARQRSFGERPVPRNPSPWLAGLGDPATAAGAAEVTPESEWRDRLAAQRDRLAGCRRPSSGLRGSPPNTDPGVVDALRAWRASTARAAGVPAHVVLHDATLAAVAVLRPATSEELLGVPGLGAVKVARYGAVLLDLVAAYRVSA